MDAVADFDAIKERAGDGGTIIALHPEPELLGRLLEKAGASRILEMRPVEGARLEESTALNQSQAAGSLAGSNR